QTTLSGPSTGHTSSCLRFGSPGFLASPVHVSVQSSLPRPSAHHGVTNRPFSTLSAWAIVVGTRPGFIATGCAAHALSVLMKDVLSSAALFFFFKKTQEKQKKNCCLYLKPHSYQFAL
ncbi:hypothetical protein L917_02547, partial [Phytophthora nicotianae]